MVKKNIAFELLVYTSREELERKDAELMEVAIEARKKAYSPYSNFEVGAAILLGNGEVVQGNNQENACYPAGLCAERVAIYYAAAKYPDVSIISIAISATSRNYVMDRPAAPCGNCRQSISEYEIKQQSPISIIMTGETGEVLKCHSVSDILPLAFNSTFLG
ncbi:Cytidine deaminase [Arenibacter antarcticus]|uniref:Cytidine deaminase n=1 Tax=Arenibacter antarcticus TaxID=2040469 RepID=A0ABW5VDZ4_9FLAO|nr:cytidine deaminase [Arenibacter sp. H213]MCM4168456.1 cytidine deaminase [Arenibacter sp. H213]